MTNNLASQIPQLNCDLGEGVSGEEKIFPWIDVGSIACGGHYGSEKTIEDTLKLAENFQKKAGAHPSYPDKENFGRESVAISLQALKKSLAGQIRLFSQVADYLNMEMDHIKFHGALYNDAARKSDLADFLSDFLMEMYPEIPVFVPPNSLMHEFALKKKLPHRLEIFGDRAYLDNYQLAPRNLKNSLLTEKEKVESHIQSILFDGLIRTMDGNFIPVKADTICFHGDNPGLPNFLPFIRQTYWT